MDRKIRDALVSKDAFADAFGRSAAFQKRVREMLLAFLTIQDVCKGKRQQMRGGDGDGCTEDDLRLAKGSLNQIDATIDALTDRLQERKQRGDPDAVLGDLYNGIKSQMMMKGLVENEVARCEAALVSADGQAAAPATAPASWPSSPQPGTASVSGSDDPTESQMRMYTNTYSDDGSMGGGRRRKGAKKAAAAAAPADKKKKRA